MLGQIVATFSIIEVSSKSEGAFFSVARTIPFVAVVCQLRSMNRSQGRGPARSKMGNRLTFDTQTGGSSSDGREGMFNLHELSRRRECSQGEAAVGQLDVPYIHHRLRRHPLAIRSSSLTSTRLHC